MKKIGFILLSFFWIGPISLSAQNYQMVIKGGHVIDPKNGIDELMDVAIQDGRIAKIAKNIDPTINLETCRNKQHTKNTI